MLVKILQKLTLNTDLQFVGHIHSSLEKPLLQKEQNATLGYLSLYVSTTRPLVLKTKNTSI